MLLLVIQCRDGNRKSRPISLGHNSRSTATLNSGIQIRDIILTKQFSVTRIPGIA